MNEHIDPAFAPMDKPTRNVGPQADGTVSYEIVEGNVYRDNELVGKAEVAGYVQIDTPDGEGSEVRE